MEKYQNIIQNILEFTILNKKYFYNPKYLGTTIDILVATNKIFDRKVKISQNGYF